jgi:transposase
MMTQEEYMDAKALRGAGWSIKQIAEHLGHHPATISKWLKNGGPPEKRSGGVQSLVIEEQWQKRVAELLSRNAHLQGSSVMRVLSSEGFTGSYSALTRYLRSVRGPTRGVVSVTMRIETNPGEEFQFDWSDCNHWARRWGWDHELHCFGCVLCWSRFKFWWFASSIDTPHTLEGLALFFEAIKGVPAVGRHDRMGQLGRSRGPRFLLHGPASSFARHHDLAFKACDAGDAKRKGKIERPFRDLKAGFLSEIDIDPPSDMFELNQKAPVWLDRWFHPLAHGTTKVPPAERFAIERNVLGMLPPVRFDTARREPRRVGRTPLVEWDTVFYSAPPDLAGRVVEVRQPVADRVLELRFLGQVVAVHRLVDPGSEPQWVPEHKAAAEAIVLGRRRLRLMEPEPWPNVREVCSNLDLEAGDYDVETPDLSPMGLIAPGPDDIWPAAATKPSDDDGCGCRGTGR